MLAVPGIIALLTFIYLRPQEISERLRELPFLYLFLFATMAGFGLDVALRKLSPRPTPQLRWGVLFLFWCAVTIVVFVPAPEMKEHMMQLLVSFILFAIIAHSVQSFRAFSAITSTVVILVLVLAMVGYHQSRQPKGCIALKRNVSAQLGEGKADGRGCDHYEDCYGDGAREDEEYLCERVGLLGTTTIEGRVRYRGVLQDPNELAMVMAIGLPFLLALASLRRRVRWYVLALIGTVLMFYVVIKTESRSGQLAFLAVLGVYFIKRYGKKGMAIGAVLALPVLLAGGRSGASASQSTMDRYEAWRAGLDMIRSNPVLGVGQGNFTEYHYLTAHNSYVLIAAELGFVGLFLWLMMIYTSFKIAYRGMKLELYGGEPGGEVTDAVIKARIWGTAVFAALVGFSISMLFLSLSYHMVLWIYLGISGGYYGVLRAEWPDLELRIGFKDYALVAAASVGIIAAVSLLLRVKGF